MSLFEDLFNYAQNEGGDVYHTKRVLPNGNIEETMMVGLPWEKAEMPLKRPKLPQETHSPMKSDNILLLPPKEQFKATLMLLLDRANATKNERSVMARLIKRFEDGDKQSKTVSQRASKA